MELDPTSETGKCLNRLLSNWISKSPVAAQDVLTRVLLMYAMKIESQENFLDALYGQRVLEEPYWDLTQERPTAMSRVRHAIGASVRSHHVKELVVALEWSRNQTVLTEILKWAEGAGTKVMTENMSNLSTMDLAPQRAAKTFSSMLLSSGSDRVVSQRERTINLNGKQSQGYGVCRNCNKILIGLETGQIKIYDSMDLKCDSVLPYYNEQSEPYCFQCTCTEIIAGYEDGSICTWDIQSGVLKQKVSVGKARPDSKDFPKRMRWQNPKLVVATNDHRIQIWQYLNASFSLLGGWNVPGLGSVRHIEFDENYVILQDNFPPFIHIYFPNGKLLRKIPNPRNTMKMAYQSGILVTGGGDKVLRIWGVDTGACLLELEGHEDKIVCIEMQKTVLLSGDNSGGVTVWDMATVMGKSAEDQPSSACSLELPSSTRLAVNLREDDLRYFVFGRGFVLVPTKKTQMYRVIDFP